MRLKLPLSETLAADREVIAQAESEIVVVKGAAMANWLAVRALNDADSVILHSLEANGLRH
jgi:hypothetical protein